MGALTSLEDWDTSLFQPTGPLPDSYSKGKLLRQGAYGAVFAFAHARTGEEVAVKVLDTRHSPSDTALREVEVLKALSHRNIVRFREAFHDEGYVCLVMDKYAGGDLLHCLLSHLDERGRIPCHRSVHLCAQAAAAVQYLHSKWIVHRDVKADNFLVDREDLLDPRCRVALADFGAARCLDSPVARLPADHGGTAIYWSPERFGCGTYGLKADVWAFGVAMYTLLAGRFPFRSEESALSRSFRPRVPSRLDEPCRDLLSRTLEMDEDVRLSADGVMTHRWLSSWTPEGEGSSCLPAGGEEVTRPLPQELLATPGLCREDLDAREGLSKDRGDAGSSTTASSVDIAGLGSDESESEHSPQSPQGE